MKVRMSVTTERVFRTIGLVIVVVKRIPIIYIRAFLKDFTDQKLKILSHLEFCMKRYTCLCLKLQQLFQFFLNFC